VGKTHSFVLKGAFFGILIAEISILAHGDGLCAETNRAGNLLEEDF
jgi:hypothetical protein